MGDLEQLLKGSGNEYEETPEEEDTPSGPSFMLQLQSAECAVSSKGGFIIKRAHLVIDGEYEGVTVRDNLHPLNGGFCTRRFKDWCRVMGYEPPASKMDIEETVATISGDDPLYMASLTKSGGFTNVVCLKLLEKEDTPGAPPMAERLAASRKTSKSAAAEPEPEIAEGDTVSFTDDEGHNVTGKVTKVGKGVADIDAPEADYRDVPVGSLIAQPPEAEAPVQDDELTDLIALAQANEIEVDDNVDRDDLVKIVKAHKWNKDDLTEDEVALLEGVGVTFKPKAAAKTAKKAKKAKKTSK